MNFELHHGDCLDVMATLPDASIDCVLTDPPYPDYYVEEFAYHDGIIDPLDGIDCRQFVFWSAKVPFPLSFTARHIWDKITGAACQYDFIYERNGGKRQRVFRGHRINSTVSAQFARERFTGHKSQKPINVLQEILQYATKPLNTILDPFMGSGSTGVACELEGRNFIGIEKDANYFEIAKNRIEGVRKKEPLFAEAA